MGRLAYSVRAIGPSAPPVASPAVSADHGAMTTIALLGTGLLGAGMVENLLAKGNQVRIWNRSPSKLAPLVAKGAHAAKDPADCVRGATRVHLVLAEDTAVDAVVAHLQPGLGKDVPVVDHSTNLPQKVAARYATLRKAGVRYVPSPVFMSPQNAREASGLLTFAAPKAEAPALETALQPMTAKAWYVGERADLPAVYKLAGNSLFFVLASALSDIFAIGRGCDVDPVTMLKLFDVFKPGAALPFIGQRILAPTGSAPSFELSMARKDARLMIEAAGGDPLQILPAVAAAMDAAIARGLGSADFAAFAQPRT